MDLDNTEINLLHSFNTLTAYISLVISNFCHFENLIKIRVTGNHDLIWNGCPIYGHGRQSVMDCVSSEQTDEELNRFVKLNYGFALNWHIRN